ncbi:hypothetical protein NMY22_g7226 [Coprinellus aureogranulatus]|nr:hypothetical protein NMY22_g7226 [Coprinellus aureogranulatus]
MLTRVILCITQASFILGANLKQPSQNTHFEQHKTDSLQDLGRQPHLYDDLEPPYQTLLSVPAQGSFPEIGIPSSPSVPQPQEVYNGGFANASTIRLRIASGGAGQTGLVREWANAFIQHLVQTHGYEPFQIGWYLGDTTDSLAMLDAGTVDVAATYNEAAENLLLTSGAATRRVYAFRGFFALVGPKSNPAGLNADTDSILTMLGKIALAGKADDQRPPTFSERLPVRFLSRFDKSATNIRESELFLKIGQVPWALAFSKWYHQYPQFPKEALRAASLTGEYTLTDTATLVSIAESDDAGILDHIEVFREGKSDDKDDMLLNPCHALLGAKANPANQDIVIAFMDWLSDKDGGRKVVRVFGKNGTAGISEPPEI